MTPKDRNGHRRVPLGPPQEQLYPSRPVESSPGPSVLGVMTPQERVELGTIDQHLAHQRALLALMDRGRRDFLRDLRDRHGLSTGRFGYNLQTGAITEVPA